MATDYGTDLAVLSTAEGLDVDPMGNVVSGVRAVAQAVALRLDTPAGGLWYDSTYGFALLDLVNADLTDRDVFRVRASVEAEALKDERVFDASAPVTFDEPELRVPLSLTTADGPFSLVLAADGVSVRILEGS